MKRAVTFILRNCWFGFAYAVVAVVGSLIYTIVAGPLFGQMNAAATAFMVLVIGIMVLAGIVGFFRQPNPYSRTYALYDLMDLPPHLDELDSGGGGWIWQAAPMILVALLLLPFFA